MATATENADDRRQASEPPTSGDGSKGNLPEAGGKPVRQRKQLTSEEKYRMFLETQRGDVLVATVLRKWGIHSSDLMRIRTQVREGALESLARGQRKGRRPQESPEVAALKAEKARVEEALKELAIENTLLRKKGN